MLNQISHLNEYLYGWVYVHKMYQAIEHKFHGTNNQDEIIPYLTGGSDPRINRLYRSLLEDWFENFKIPGHILNATKFIYGDKWKIEYERWVGSLELGLSISAPEQNDVKNSTLAVISGPSSSICLIEEVAICLGNSFDFVNELEILKLEKIIPDLHDRIILNSRNPSPIMYKIHEAVLRQLGFTDKSFGPDFEPLKPDFTINSYGKPYFTLSGKPPFLSEIDSMVETVRESESKTKSKLGWL